MVSKFKDYDTISECSYNLELSPLYLNLLTDNQIGKRKENIVVILDIEVSFHRWFTTMCMLELAKNKLTFHSLSSSMVY